MIATLAEAALRSFVLGGAVWFGLTVFRVRNPHIHMTAWVVVLFASLAMPFVMHWPTLTLMRPPVAIPLADEFWPAEAIADFAPPGLPSGVDPATVSTAKPPIGWLGLLTVGYVCIAGILLLRLAIGIGLTWRLARAARPLKAPHVVDADVRISRKVGGPVTFGSTILVPQQFQQWDSRKRLAVLAHEGAHVANHDFYILLFAALNRAVFWFSPFSWWQAARLAELAEIISDSTAIEAIADRLSYAEILLEVATSARPRAMELAMARASTVRFRIERIIAAAATPPSVGRLKRVVIAATIAPAVIVSAGMIAYRTPEIRLSNDSELDAGQEQHVRSVVDFYAVRPGLVFAIFRDGDSILGQLTGQRKLRMSMQDGTASYVGTSAKIDVRLDDQRRSSDLMMTLNGREVRAVRIAAMPAPGSPSRSLDAYVGKYKIASRVLTVRREHDRLLAYETGGSAAVLVTEGGDAFSIRGSDLIVFLGDDQAQANRILLYTASSGARLASRIDSATADAMDADFARRMVTISERFRDQIPAPGSKEMVLRGIESMRRGEPAYEAMSASLASKVRSHLDELRSAFQAMGKVESIFFRGVGPGGYDIYGATFENGTAEFRLLIDPDGKAGDVIFRPDGNDEPGAILACSEEAAARGHVGTSPIRVMVYNEGGEDLQLVNLDEQGHRGAQTTVGANMSSSFLTTVNSPWIIADRSGRCLNILLPGRQTRFYNMDASRSSGPLGRSARRNTPIADGEEILRHYIEGVGSGRPDYARMTSEVAEQTRQQLPFDQAILNRLGALRAMSFRGVTALDSDIYIAQFTNGSAEWRIGVRNGTITKIALGPNF